MSALKAVICIISGLLLSTNAITESFSSKLTEAALARTQANVTYDGSYIAIPYPNGDVPANIGVCTDVIIRSYRAF